MVVDRIKLTALQRLPKNFVSRVFGTVCETEFPAPVQRVVNETFANLAGIDTSEGERAPAEYRTLNAYFTRRLRQGARQVESTEPEIMVSPVDGRVGAYGRVTQDTLLQAKGREYRLVDLVDSGEEAERFSGGHFVTIYLSPRDYHRIHSPAPGTIDKVSYIPGHLFPVNPFAVENIDELFAVNERLISYIDSPTFERVAVIKVGATCVGKIGLAFDEFQTNGKFRRREEFAPRQPVEVGHGDEVGVFNLGSTVILLIANPDFALDADIESGQMVRMGQILGRVPATKKSAARKPAATKKTAAKKPAESKATAKKPSAKKETAKAQAKKETAKKETAKKETAKAPAKKETAKKETAKARSTEKSKG